MDGGSELLRRRVGRIVGGELGIVGLVPVGPPVALVLAAIGVIDNHAAVAVAVGNIEFVGLWIDERLRWKAEIGCIVAALTLIGATDLHQQLASLCELEEHAVVDRAGTGHAAFIMGEGGRLRAAAIATDPYIAFVVDIDAVVGRGPVIAVAGATPMADQVASGIELKDRGRGCATLRLRRLGSCILFFCFERAFAVDDPDMIVGIDTESNNSADDPMIGEWLGPEGIYFKARGLDGGGFNG